MNTLGQRIREIRLKKGLTQIDLSKGICTPSMVSQIESDRARPSYKVLFGIAERLDVPLEKLLADIDLQLEYVSNYKLATAMIRSNQHAAAIPLLLELLESGRGGQITRMDILLELGECYLQTSQLDQADHTFNQVQQLATSRQDGHLICTTLKNLGVIALHRKQYQLAIYKFHKALEELESLQPHDPMLIAVIHSHIGQTFSKLGQVAEAVDHFKHSAELYKKAENPAELANAYMEIAKSLNKLADYNTANEYSDRAVALFDLAKDQYQSLKTKVICAVNEGLSGEAQTATRALEQLIMKFQELQRTTDVGTTYVELAKVYLHHDQLEKAAEACHIARTLLPEMHLCQAWISRIHGLIAMKREQQHDAIRFFNRAAERFKHHEEVGEWEKTMYDLARLHYDTGDYTRAFTYIEEIRHQVHTTLRNRGIVL